MSGYLILAGALLTCCLMSCSVGGGGTPADKSTGKRHTLRINPVSQLRKNLNDSIDGDGGNPGDLLHMETSVLSSTTSGRAHTLRLAIHPTLVNTRETDGGGPEHEILVTPSAKEATVTWTGDEGAFFIGQAIEAAFDRHGTIHQIIGAWNLAGRKQKVPGGWLAEVRPADDGYILYTRPIGEQRQRLQERGTKMMRIGGSRIFRVDDPGFTLERHEIGERIGAFIELRNGTNYVVDFDHGSSATDLSWLETATAREGFD